MNIVVLMASPDLDYEKQFGYPKALTEVQGITIIKRFIESCLDLFKEANNVTFVIRKEHNKKYYLGEIIKLLFKEAIIIEIDGDTHGAACSTLLAIDYIDLDEQLFVISGDEILDLDLLNLKDYFEKKKSDGGVIIFDSVHPRFSYVRCEKDNIVIEASEKRPISNHATVGLYYYAKGKYCIDSIQSTIVKGATVNNKFYLCPAFNEMILANKTIIAYPIDNDDYHPLKSSETIQEYNRYLEGH
jgi:dTDP-glucose pyrophosphorylase